MTLPVIVYAAKSTEDKRGSIPTQLADCHAAVEREGGRAVRATYQDEGKSAFKGNRGDGLARAKEHASELAAEHGSAELWVQHSDRLARGDGLTADHLAEIFFAMRRRGVRLRSVQDDSNLEDVIRVALIGERNTEDSRRKSEAVKAGKARQIARGERMGGPVPDGYVIHKTVTDGRVVASYALDTERAAIIGRVFEMSGQGIGDPTIARRLNAEGYRTKAGRDWTRRRVQDTLTNPFYAGRVVRFRGKADEQTAEGQHPAIVSPALFDALKVRRAERDKAAGSARSPKGRPPTNYALSRLAKCGRCGGGMYAVTSPYKRKDGSKLRQYLCPAYKNATGTCDAPPVNGELVDGTVTDRLNGYFVDFDGWLAEVASLQNEQRAGVERSLSADRERRDKLARRESKLRERWLDALEGDGDGEDTYRRELERATLEREQAERRIAELESVMGETMELDSIDALLDFYNDLGAAVRGHVNKGSMREVNEGLRELFAAFIIDTTAEGVTVEPVLREDVGLVIRPHPLYPYSTEASVQTEDGLARLPLVETVARGGETITPPFRRVMLPNENGRNTHA